MQKRNLQPLGILVVGASYGLLLGAKLAAGGHRVTVTGFPDEIAAIKRSGVSIVFPDGTELRPPLGPNGMSFATPDVVKAQDFNIMFLAVQEPQVATPEIADLLFAVAAHLPIASIMNMPPPPFLDRVPNLPKFRGENMFSSRAVWDQILPARFTLASPDPQAYRPDPITMPGKLRVTLASNFKFAPFEDAADQEVLGRVARDASQVTTSNGRVPVQLVTRTSLYTPMAKWPMLVTGNCRCISAGDEIMSISDAVRRDIDESRILYDAVNAALRACGAPDRALVPFEAYFKAARLLERPSSLARNLDLGAKKVERIDLLILELLKRANFHGNSPALAIMERTSAIISDKLKRNCS